MTGEESRENTGTPGPCKINIPLGLPYDIVVRTAGSDTVITGVMGIEIPFASASSAQNVLDGIWKFMSLLPDGPVIIQGKVIANDSDKQLGD